MKERRLPHTKTAKADTYERVPKLPCPTCSEPISISLHSLVHGENILCPHCMMEIKSNVGHDEVVRNIQNFYRSQE